ncbi:NAD(P)-binding domain-containing protein [Nocardia sp. NPDC048505]|uniref:NADPH-dependent F420 reductase n=1 Tax=unclassified Nocardia TaxID=2637762 RepID=UPI0033D0434C
MTTLGLIGGGRIGGTVARLAVDAGLEVVLSNSRGPESLRELIADLGSRARATGAQEAAEAGDIVVVCTPFRVYRTLPVAALAGKVVLDTTNYNAQRDGAIPELDANSVTSSELLQAELPTSQVVKAFNTIFVTHLAALPRPAGAADRSAIPIAGDHDTAKTVAAELLDTLGYDTVDIGPLAESWRLRPGSPAYGVPYASGTPFWEHEAAPGDPATVRAAVEKAER